MAIKKEIKEEPKDPEIPTTYNKKEPSVKKETNVKTEGKPKTGSSKSKGGPKKEVNKKKVSSMYNPDVIITLDAPRLFYVFCLIYFMFSPSKILAYMAEELGNLNRKIIPKQELAEACGYSRPGSHGFSYAFSELKAEGKIANTKGGCYLTDLGKESVPKESFSFSQPKTNADKQEHFYKLLRKRCKEGSNEKTKILFDILSDGKSHSLKEFTDATGYANYKSKGLGYNLTCMVKEMKIAEKTGSKEWRFTDICFPQGRPE